MINKNSYNSRTCNFSGFTLMEVAIALAVVGLIFAGIWVGAGAVMEKQKVYRVNEQMMTTVQGVKNRSRLVPGADGDDVTAIIDAALILPSEMNIGGGNYMHAFGGQFIARRVNERRLRIEINGITQPQCIGLLLNLPLEDTSVGIVQVNTNANIIDIDLINVAAPAGATALPLTALVVAPWCNLGDNGNNVAIDFNL